jgi:hypothetical protein
MANRGRPVTVDHRHASHRSIAMTAERSRALARAATMLGISGDALIRKLVDAGLAVIDPDGAS